MTTTTPEDGNFHDVDFPLTFATNLMKEGGKPVKAMVRTRMPNIVALLVSDDPSGPDNSEVRHLSISCSTYGMTRNPTAGEMIAALFEIGWVISECTFVSGRGCVHVFLTSNLPLELRPISQEARS